MPISALQHLLYCPRQCALIHVERIWVENAATAEGRLLHGRIEQGLSDRRRGVRTERSVPLRSFHLGVFGIADVVEVRAGGRVLPVEYKRGRPKHHRADEVQLCAQGICLEEMLDRPVSEGALFYGRNRRRQLVEFDAALRKLTADSAREVRRLVETCSTPAPVYEPGKCDPCSLKTACQPERFRRPGAAGRWLARELTD